MTKNILITAGGTSEAIDGVRKITNFSTGSLGLAIYEEGAKYLAENKELEGKYQVYYVMAEGAVKPQARENLPIIFHPISDVASLEKKLEELLTSQKIDILIHAMAVSDFTKDYLIERGLLAKEISEKISSDLKEKKDLSQEDLEDLILKVLEKPEGQMNLDSKVSSKADLLLTLKRTPKIISKIKKWSPDTFLLGFKLLKDVPQEELIQVAADMAEKNSCDLVLANDLSKIDGNKHHGLLLKGHEILGQYASKKEIARAIIEEVVK